MLGPKIRNVFKSRWHAVAWSASILLTAYCSVPSPDQINDPQSRKDAEAIAALLSGGKTAEPAHHVNPWAKSSGAAGQ